MAVVVGWILHTELHKNTESEPTHLNFCREVILSLLLMKPKFHSNPGHRPTSSVCTTARYALFATQGHCVVCQKIQEECVLNVKSGCSNTVIPLIPDSSTNLKKINK